jgi:hypothetical protein
MSRATVDAIRQPGCPRVFELELLPVRLHSTPSAINTERWWVKDQVTESKGKHHHHRPHKHHGGSPPGQVQERLSTLSVAGADKAVRNRSRSMDVNSTHGISRSMRYSSGKVNTVLSIVAHANELLSSDAVNGSSGIESVQESPPFVRAADCPVGGTIPSFLNPLELARSEAYSLPIPASPSIDVRIEKRTLDLEDALLSDEDTRAGINSTKDIKVVQDPFVYQ